MGDPVRITAAGFTSTDQQTTFHRHLTIDLTTAFTGHGVLPAIAGVAHGPDGWRGAGSTRKITFSDRGEVQERLTEFEPGTRYVYEATNFTNVLRFLVSGATGEWRFRSDLKGGTAVEWAFTFHPLPGRGGIVRALLAKPWQRYMNEIMARVVDQIEAGAALR